MLCLLDRDHPGIIEDGSEIAGENVGLVQVNGVHSDWQRTTYDPDTLKRDRGNRSIGSGFRIPVLRRCSDPASGAFAIRYADFCQSELISLLVY